MAAKYFWIMERCNPQFKKPYYVGLGQISVKEAKKHENPIYGNNIVHKWLSKESYEGELQRLKDAGYRVQ